jgi:hypothetical protein
MSDWSIDRWLALGALIVAILGCGLAYHFYRKTIRTKLLAIAHSSPVPFAVADPAVSMPADAKQVRTFVLLWNQGSAPIVETDFTKPISIDNAKEVTMVSIFDKDAASTILLDDVTKEITIKLLRPNEAVILEIVAAPRETFSLSVEMVSADMSVFYQRNRRFPPGLEFPVVMVIALCLSLFLWWIMSASSLPPSLMKGLLLLIVALIPALAIPLGNKYVPKLQRNITPSVVWHFFKLKEAAQFAQSASRNFQNALTWFQRGN